MGKSFLESLKGKVGIIRKFDEEIAARKNKGKLNVVNTDAVDPKELLKKYQEEMKAKEETEILEAIKKDFTRPDILGQLQTEFYENVSLLEVESNKLTEEANELKTKYKADLKELDNKHSEIANKHMRLRNEYLGICEELGFDYGEAETKFGWMFASSGAANVSRESHSIN